MRADCKLWTGTTDNYGYGVFKVKGKMVKAHRMAWIAKHGPIPGGLCVLHHCDVPGCVNVEHLWLGTNADNQHDKVAKGRQVRGASTNTAKLTPDAVASIRHRFAQGESYRILAAEFGVHFGTIYYVVRRKSWRHM